MRKRVLLSLLGLVVVGLALAASTQYVAATLGFHRQLGAPLTTVAGVRVYPPWAWLEWDERLHRFAPRAFAIASVVTYGALLVIVASLVALAAVGNRRSRESTSHGSARWGTTAELRRGGMLGSDGIVLCQTSEARFSSVLDDKGALKWKMRRPGQLVRHEGPEHVFVFAPTRSGKGIGIVMPTLFAWGQSALIYDIKKELWSLTAGYRRKFSYCWRFEPTAPDSVRFNPLFEIRRGDNEVRDAQVIADILVDPDGAGTKWDHWQTTAHALLVGAILHVLYAESDKSLTGVGAFLASPERSQVQTLQRMLRTNHLPSGPHPVVAQVARSMLNKADNELSGVVSTATSYLDLFRDPLVGRATSASDFRIADLMNLDHPVSLYLVVPPSDLSRLRRVIRLILNQVGQRLTERMEFAPASPPRRPPFLAALQEALASKGPDAMRGAVPLSPNRGYRHRLLLLVDEFTSLGKLDFFENQLAFCAGYGLKCFMVAQSLNQLQKTYGEKNSILDNSHIRVTYAANDEITARRISDLVGQATLTKRQRSFSAPKLLGGRSVSESEQEFARPLLTADEVLRLPYDEAILLVSGMAPYRGKKLMYYLDPRFSARAILPPPNGPREQRAQLPRRSGAASEWAALRPIEEVAPPPSPPTPPDVGQPAVVSPPKPAVGSGEPAIEVDLTDGAFASVFEQVDEVEESDRVPGRAP
ncbi:MAG TPA: IncP-type conjugal transfer protein TraG [Polyangia bacterium]|jgi:type IV secretion system protein VirD4|nr:IncP-type conjugal transfer protein TraG [Polyangia bacterium]